MTIENSTFWDFIFELDNGANERGTADDDEGFVDGSVFTRGATNTVEPTSAPFTMRDCVNRRVPSRWFSSRTPARSLTEPTG